MDTISKVLPVYRPLNKQVNLASRRMLPGYYLPLVKIVVVIGHAEITVSNLDTDLVLC